MGEVAREERIRLYAEEIHVATGLETWCFLQKGQEPVYSTSLFPDEMYYLFKNSKCLNILNKEDGYAKPIILSDNRGLFWIAEHFYKESKPVLFFVMGPIMLKSSQHKLLEKQVESYELTFDQRRKMLDAIQKIPAMSVSMLHQYAAMFHYALTEEEVRPRDFIYPQNVKEQLEDFESEVIKEYEDMHGAEHLVLQAVSEGNLHIDKVLDEVANFGGDYVSDSGDVLRDAKNTALIFTALVSRAAIKGGLSIVNAKETELYYLNQIESCLTIGELTTVNQNMLQEFVKRVYQIKHLASHSSRIQLVCDYINSNITGDISVKTLASRAFYTEYYLSKKFHKEMGIKITDYIKEEKVKHAKIYLSDTNKSIQEISDLLNFSTRNYFTTVFKDITGSTPAQYREQSKLGTKPD